jgi:hypothetical protein
MAKRITAFAVVAVVFFIGALGIYLRTEKQKSVASTRPGDAPSKMVVHAETPLEILPLPKSEPLQLAASTPAPVDSLTRPQITLPEAVRNRFGKAIKGLKLSAEDEQKVIELLIARAESGYHAREILTQDERNNLAFYHAAIASAQADIDKEITAHFSPELSGKILNLVNARMYLAVINDTIEPAMASAGVPMAPEQVIPLLDVFYETYDRDLASDMRYVQQQINTATGLTDLDELALARSKGVLSPRQLETLRTALLKRNSVMISRPQI